MTLTAYVTANIIHLVTALSGFTTRAFLKLSKYKCHKYEGKKPPFILHSKLYRNNMYSFSISRFLTSFVKHWSSGYNFCFKTGKSWEVIQQFLLNWYNIWASVPAISVYVEEINKAAMRKQ